MDLRLVLSKSMHETHIHSYYNKAYKAAAYVVSKKKDAAYDLSQRYLLRT